MVSFEEKLAYLLLGKIVKLNDFCLFVLYRIRLYMRLMCALGWLCHKMSQKMPKSAATFCHGHRRPQGAVNNVEYDNRSCVLHFFRHKHKIYKIVDILGRTKCEAARRRGKTF